LQQKPPRNQFGFRAVSSKTTVFGFGLETGPALDGLTE